MCAPLRKAVLRLEGFEDRAVPSTVPLDPPLNTGLISSPGSLTQAVSVTVAPGEYVNAGRVGDTDVLFAVDPAGREWVYAVDAASGAFTAALVNYDGTFNPAADAAFQSGFQADSAKWSFAWNPTIEAWSTLAPGALTGAVASGFASGSWNVVALVGAPPIVPSVLPNPDPLPVAPAPRPVEIQIQVGPNITITIPNLPPGSTITAGPNGTLTIVIGGQPQRVVPGVPTAPMIPPPNFDPPKLPNRPSGPDGWLYQPWGPIPRPNPVVPPVIPPAQP